MKRRLVEQTSECNIKIYKQQGTGKMVADATDINEFLKNIDGKDYTIATAWKFKNDSAAAVGDYLGYPDVDSREKLWKLLSPKHEEFEGGVGPQAQGVIAGLLNKRCQALATAAAKKAEEIANYRPSVTGPMWEQIMRLWDNDADMKQQFLTIINDTVAKQMENFSYDEVHTFTAKNRFYTGTAFGYYITGPPTFKASLRVKAYNATVNLTAIKQHDATEWMKVSGKFNGTAQIVGIATKKLKGRVSMWVRVVDGNAQAQLASLKVSVYENDGKTPYKFEVWPLEFRLISNKVKLYNDTWCGGYCTSWDTGLESEAKSEVGTQTEDIMPYLKEYNIV